MSGDCAEVSADGYARTGQGGDWPDIKIRIPYCSCGLLMVPHGSDESGWLYRCVGCDAALGDMT